jgi:hypothetical protein
VLETVHLVSHRRRQINRLYWDGLPMPLDNPILLPSPEQAAKILGGELQPGGKQILCPGPNHSENDRSLSIKFDATAPDGFTVWSFTRDDPLACKDYVRDVLGLPEFGSRRRAISVDYVAIARKRAKAAAQHAAYAERQREKAKWLWSISQPIKGTPAERYLRAKRKLAIIPDTVRFLPAKGAFPPAMIVAYGLPAEPEPGRYAPLPASKVLAIHITRLLPDGSDRDRSDGAKHMIASPGSCPIALIPPNDLGGLLVAEGVETALSFAHTGLGIWAAGAKDRLVTIAPTIAALPHVEAVTISPDDDDPAKTGFGFTSRDRAEKLADMLAELPDIEVRII